MKRVEEVYRSYRTQLKKKNKNRIARILEGKEKEKGI